LDTVQSTLRNLPLRLDSNVFTYSLLENGTYEIREWFKAKAGSLLSSRFAQITRNGDLAEPIRPIWERRQDFGGVTLINNVLTWMPYNMVDDLSNPTGACVDIVNMMAAHFNFTLQWRKPADRPWL